MPYRYSKTKTTFNTHYSLKENLISKNRFSTFYHDEEDEEDSDTWSKKDRKQSISDEEINKIKSDTKSYTEKVKKNIFSKSDDEDANESKKKDYLERKRCK